VARDSYRRYAEQHMRPISREFDEREHERLADKRMRDAKINDIFEGTQQTNLLIIARRILGYGSHELD
jgi:hypothetical protein